MKFEKNVRLIDANKLKEHVSSFTGRFTPGGGFEVSLDAVLHAIDRAERFKDVEPVRRWISVNNRLPDTAEPVLVICDGNYMMASYGYTKTFGTGWYAATDGYTTCMISSDDVTHWFPLPKKPKVEKTYEQRKTEDETYE